MWWRIVDGWKGVGENKREKKKKRRTGGGGGGGLLSLTGTNVAVLGRVNVEMGAREGGREGR